MGNSTSTLYSGTAVFNWSGSANQWFDAVQIQSGFGANNGLPAYGSTITSCFARYEVMRSSASTGAAWSIADDNKSGKTTILANGSLSTSFTTKEANLLSKGLCATTYGSQDYAVMPKNTYLRFRGEVNTLNGQFKNCRVEMSWNNLARTIKVSSSVGDNAKITNVQGYNSCSVSLADSNKTANITAVYSNSIAVVDISASDVSGYNFVGWYLGNSLVSKNKTYQITQTYNTNTSNETYVAKYEPITTGTNNIYLGNNKIQSIYLGNTPVKAVYVGNTKVYEV